jgi:SAM-dependent methyltransferase
MADGQREVFQHPESLWDHWDIAMAKPPMRFEDTPKDVPGRYVQLGPGHKHIAGWHNLDYPEWNADKMPLPYDDGTVSGIASYHTLDHLSNPIAVLAEIQRVLKPGGWFVNIVPHYSSELWHSDLTHKSQFATETWKSIFSTRHYDHAAFNVDAEWDLRIEFNLIMAYTERNTVLVTKLVKGGEG